MSSFSATSDVFQLRPYTKEEAASLQAIWAASQDEDDPAMRPRDGWWSIVEWATASRALVERDVLIGLVAIHHDPVTGIAEARLALLPAYRQPGHADQLVQAATDLARQSGALSLRLFLPTSAGWAASPALLQGFQPYRTVHVMLRPEPLPVAPVAGIEGITIRPLLEHEEGTLLSTLNRAWADTWNARPISAETLARDLRGQREGMLVALETAEQGRIVATCHAVFEPTGQNPDGHPLAWISNLTTDPDWRGRGLGRAMLTAGLNHLCSRGAHSVALEVDGEAAAPVALYQSMGFETISTSALWTQPT